MNHFLSITDILLEPIIGMEYPRMLWHCRELPGICVHRTVQSWDGDWLPRSEPEQSALASTSPASSGGTGARQAGDGGAGARYQPRVPGPGHTPGRISSLSTGVPWCSRGMVTSVGLFWAGAGQRGEVARLQWSLDNYLGSGHWSQPGLSNTWRDQTSRN